MLSRSSIRRAAAVAVLAAVTAGAAILNEDGRERIVTARTAAMQDIALVDEMVMTPMRDGVRLAGDVYLPKDGEGPFPTIYWRTPYDFNELAGTRLAMARAAVTRGYAFVIHNERGRYFSEGEWEILGEPRTDGYDALTWIAEQSWSNGKVGTFGCSSSAEWQLALAAQDHPAHAAMVPAAPGAGIGRVGPYWEQGNWYRGGIFQMLFATWLYSVQQDDGPRFPEGLDRETLARLANSYDLAADMARVDWSEGLRHLPLKDLLDQDGARANAGPYADMIARGPADADWFEGGLYHDDEAWGVPALWLNSWYDVSIGPNMALYEHARTKGADAAVRDGQYAMIAPIAHCRFFRDGPGADVTVGERLMPKAGLAYEDIVFSWFDRWLKDDAGAFEQAKVRYYMMGADAGWREAESWPPENARMKTFHLGAFEPANSLYGGGALSETPMDDGRSGDVFIYDPMNPVPSKGGAVCCIGGAAEAGSFDQRAIEARQDVLVYTSEPLDEPLSVAGAVEATLYVSSDARDTDFHIKLVDVAPDGTAMNVADTAMRARYRDGWDKEVFFDGGDVARLDFTPMMTANTFAAGHRVRVEITSSNFPIYARNLNTGGPAHEETEPVVARNVVRHDAERPSQIRLPVLAN